MGFWPKSRPPKRLPIPSRRSSRIFPPRRRTSSTCTWPARPSQLDLFDYKPKLQRAERPAVPESLFKKAAVRLHQGRAEDARHAAQVRAARPERRVSQRTCCRTWRGRRTTSPSSDRCTPTSSTMRPAQLFLHTGSPQLGPARHGLVGHLRAGQREPEPARLRRADLAAATPRRRRGALGQRLSADASIRACNAARTATRCCTCPTRRA